MRCKCDTEYPGRVAQQTAQRKAYRQRQQVMRADKWIEESLSFAGTNPLM